MGDKKKKQEKIMKVKKNFYSDDRFTFYTGRMYCAANLKWTKKEEKRIFRHSIKKLLQRIKKKTPKFLQVTRDTHFKHMPQTNTYVGQTAGGGGGGVKKILSY